MPSSSSVRLPSNRAIGLLYKEIATELRRRIADQTYPPGNKIQGSTSSSGNSASVPSRCGARCANSRPKDCCTAQQGLGVFTKPKQKIHRLLVGDVDT